MSVVARLAQKNMFSRADIKNAILNISGAEHLAGSPLTNRRKELVTTQADANDPGSRLGDLWARALIDIADINCHQMHITNGKVTFALDDNGEDAQATLKQRGITATIDIDDHDQTHTLTVDLIQPNITENLETALVAKISAGKQDISQIQQQVKHELWRDMPEIATEKAETLDGERVPARR